MQLPLPIPFRLHRKPAMYRRLASLIILVSLVTTGQDYLSALGQQGSYYFSESLLFSSFWWIFPPLLWIQHRHAGRLFAGSISTRLFWMIWPVAAHLLLYPLLVDALAQLTLGHGFRWAQTLRYGLSQYAIIVLAGYALPFMAVFLSARPNTYDIPDTAPAEAERNRDVHDDSPCESPAGMLDTIMVKEGTRTILVPVADILLFSAASPYVRLHTAQRQFLVTDTLRTLSMRLDGERFTRIHKSAIVQLDAVVEIRSRQNGDYDLVLANGSETRLSRSFVPSFRKAITARGHHRFTHRDGLGPVPNPLRGTIPAGGHNGIGLPKESLR